MKNHLIALFFVPLVLVGCTRVEHGRQSLENVSKKESASKQLDSGELRKAESVANKTATTVDATDASAAKGADEQRAEQGLAPVQKISELTYQGRYRITLIDNSLSSCYLLDRSKRSDCSFTISLKDQEDGWEAYLLNKDSHLTYLNDITVDTLNYSCLHMTKEHEANDYRSENLHYTIPAIRRRIKELQAVFPDFQVVHAKFLNIFYSKDSNHAYFKQWGEQYQPKIVNDADPNDFETIPDYLPLAKDNHAVYFYGDKIDFKPQNLRPINQSYIVNDNKAIYLGPADNGFYYLRIADSIDGTAAQNIKNDFDEYIKDDKSVLFKGTILTGADVATFKCISPFHCKDKSKVYYGGKIIKGADPKTFKVINTSEAFDKYHRYFDDKTI